MALNTAGRCEHCNGIVQNIDGRRIPIDKLTAIHNQSCPGQPKTKTKEKQP